MGKLFVRERVVIEEGDSEPRFAVVAVEGSDVKLKFYKTHLRKSEVETIAKSAGADIVWLPGGEGKHRAEGTGGGSRRHFRKQPGIAGDVETT